MEAFIFSLDTAKILQGYAQQLFGVCFQNSLETSSGDARDVYHVGFHITDKLDETLHVMVKHVF